MEWNGKHRKAGLSQISCQALLLCDFVLTDSFCLAHLGILGLEVKILGHKLKEALELYLCSFSFGFLLSFISCYFQEKPQIQVHRCAFVVCIEL